MQTHYITKWQRPLNTRTTFHVIHLKASSGAVLNPSQLMCNHSSHNSHCTMSSQHSGIESRQNKLVSQIFLSIKYRPFLLERQGWCFQSVLLGGSISADGFWPGGPKLGGPKSAGTPAYRRVAVCIVELFTSQVTPFVALIHLSFIQWSR